MAWNSIPFGHRRGRSRHAEWKLSQIRDRKSRCPQTRCRGFRTWTMSRRSPSGTPGVFTSAQDPAPHLDALQRAGCARTFTDQATGAVTGRPELTRLLERLLVGDTLVIGKA